MISGIILFVCFLILFFLGMPIAFAMIITSSVYLVTYLDISMLIVPHRMITFIDSYPLLAVPFFILVGQLMNSGEITKKLFKFCQTLVGHIPGGLGHVNVLASMIFAGMSGAAAADAGGLGAIEIKAMKEAKYEPGFIAAVTTASSTIGPIIPPSTAMVIYGSIASVSIGRLLIGGLIPGVLAGVLMMVVIYIIARIKKYPKGNRSTFREIIRGFINAFPAMLTPIILIGGILLGIFTPTEAGAVAATYAFFLIFFGYKKLSLKKLFDIITEAGIISATILFMIGAAGVFGFVLTRQNVPQILFEAIISLSNNPVIILILINVFLIILGMVLDVQAILAIIAVILPPLAIKLGMDPVHMGVMIVLNLMIGLASPPVGLCMFIVNRMVGIGVKTYTKAAIPFLIILIVTVALVAFIPELVTALPNYFFGAPIG